MGDPLLDVKVRQRRENFAGQEADRAAGQAAVSGYEIQKVATPRIFESDKQGAVCLGRVEHAAYKREVQAVHDFDLVRPLIARREGFDFDRHSGAARAMLDEVDRRRRADAECVKRGEVRERHAGAEELSHCEKRWQVNCPLSDN